MTLNVAAQPFPHVVVDGWWDEPMLRAVLDEFPDPAADGWRRYDNSNERKLEGPPAMWGEATHALLAAIEARIPEMEDAFGIPGLHMETIGGGYHCIAPGGFLAVHTDFNRSPKTGRHRRLNLLVYLNDAWQEPMDGGHLELWNASGCEVSIRPEFNTTAIFETSDRSWHGHPNPATRWRRSVAAYFFTDEPAAGYRADHSTVWHDGQAR